VAAPNRTAQSESANVIQTFTRFEGVATLARGAPVAAAAPGKTTTPATAQVNRKNWGLLGRQKIAIFPEQGFLIVHLHSGRITTVIDGREEKRNAGDFWTVPAGSRMSVEVTSESASLETFSVK
jgi:hypothetical protein